MRSVINLLQFRFSPRVRQAASRAAALVAANSEIRRDFQRVHGIEAVVLLETGLLSVQPEAATEAPGHGPLKILWSGQLKHHKALHLLIRALAGLPPEAPYTLKILGDGPLKGAWQSLARRLGVEPQCRWLGWVPHLQALQEYQWADIVVFTSLRDTSSNVVLEALSRGVPVICLGHQGVADIISSSCGVKIPVTNPEEVVAGLRQAITHFAAHRAALASLAAGALARAQDFLWSRNGEEMAKIYAAVWDKREPRGGSRSLVPY